MGMSGRCAELMRWEFEGAFRSIISPAFCRFLSPSVALNILFSGGVVNEKVAKAIAEQLANLNKGE